MQLDLDFHVRIYRWSRWGEMETQGAKENFLFVDAC